MARKRNTEPEEEVAPEEGEAPVRPAKGPAKAAGPSRIWKILELVLYGLLGLTGTAVLVGTSYGVAVHALGQRKSEMGRRLPVRAELAAAGAPVGHDLAPAHLGALKPFDFKTAFRSNTADVEEAHTVTVSLSIGFAGENEAFAREITERESEFRDAINRILAEETAADLRSIEGMIYLRERIVATLNQRLVDGKIDEVFIRELAVN